MNTCAHSQYRATYIAQRLNQVMAAVPDDVFMDTADNTDDDPVDIKVGTLYTGIVGIKHYRGVVGDG